MSEQREHISQEELEHRIVDEILNATEETDESFSKDKSALETHDIKKVLFRYGKKELRLVYEKDSATVETHVKNIDDDADTKEHETTYLYKAAKEHMEREAKKLDKQLIYYFRTRNEQMKARAQSTGNDIFHWDDIKTRKIKSIRDKEFSGEWMRCVKKFLPKKQHEQK